MIQDNNLIVLFLTNIVINVKIQTLVNVSDHSGHPHTVLHDPPTFCVAPQIHMHGAYSVFRFRTSDWQLELRTDPECSHHVLDRDFRPLDCPQNGVLH